MNCPICSGKRTVWQGNSSIGVMKCIPCPMCGNAMKMKSKGTEQMINVDEIQKNIAVPLVVQYVSEHLNSEDFKKSNNKDSEFSERERKSFVVLDVYRKVRYSLIERELKSIVEKDDFSLISNKLVDLSRQVMSFEEELYDLLQQEIHDEWRDDAVMSIYYAIMSSENINLLDVIEKTVDAAWS